MKLALILLIVANIVFARAFGQAAADAILNPGTPDAAVNIYDPALGRSHVVQLEYLDLVGEPGIHWFEDGSGMTRAAFDQAQARWQLRIAGAHGSHYR